MGSSPLKVSVSHPFEAPAERVFDTWLDPQNAQHRLFATEAGVMVRTEIDPRVGGTFNIVERRDGEDVAHTGEYLALDRPRRLSFTNSIDWLEQVGLVTRNRHPDDRRKIVIAPTAKNREMQRLYEEVSEEMSSQFYHGFSAAEITDFEASLERILENLAAAER